MPTMTAVPTMPPVPKTTASVRTITDQQELVERVRVRIESCRQDASRFPVHGPCMDTELRRLARLLDAGWADDQRAPDMTGEASEITDMVRLVDRARYRLRLCRHDPRGLAFYTRWMDAEVRQLARLLDVDHR